eukprot:15327793-Ditylum_brightwellii.AAC.1
MVHMKQYPFGIMKKEWHVPPYLLHGKRKSHSIWGGTTKDFTKRNKATDACECIGQRPKNLDDFNPEMYGVDCWDLKIYSKNGRHLIEMYGKQCKWKV